MRALAVNRKIAAMTNSAIALNFNQPPDIHLNFFAKIAFDAAFGFDGLANVIELIFREIFNFFLLVNLGLGAETRARGWPMP